MGDFDRKSSDGGGASGAGESAGWPGKQSLVQRRYAGAIQRRAAGGEPGGAEGAGVEARGGGGGAPMPAAVESKMSQAFGIDLSGVRIHEGTDASAMGAQAYTRGTDVHFAPGRYEPHSPGGQELLGHELAHVVQQGQGRVAATTQAKGLALNDDPGLEREADELGARAARGERVHAGVATLAGSGGPVQMKREPISDEGMKVLETAKTYYALVNSRRKLQKTTIERYATKVTDQATALDLTKEKNEDFTSLMKVFVAGMHNRNEVLRGLVKQKLDALGVEIDAEAEKKEEAEDQETREGGHAIARHGPEVSDEALVKRLHTGIAPDDALVPAPGASSRFNSYTDMMETRQKAALAVQTAIVDAQAKVVQWSVNDQPNLAQVAIDRGQDVTDRTDELNTARNDVRAPGLDRVERARRGALVATAQTNQRNAQAEEAKAVDERDNPGKHLARIRPTLTKVKLDIKDDAGPGAALEDGVELIDNYSVVVDNGKPIGTGFEADDGDAIKLSDLIPQVSDNGAPPNPKSKPEILNALTTMGVGGDLNEFVDYLSDSANLDSVKKKGEKGAKIYKNTKPSGALTQSFTNLRAGTKKLFDNTGMPLPIDTTAWEAIQHFPAPKGSTVGVQD